MSKTPATSQSQPALVHGLQLIMPSMCPEGTNEWWHSIYTNLHCSRAGLGWAGQRRQIRLNLTYFVFFLWSGRGQC